MAESEMERRSNEGLMGIRTTQSEKMTRRRWLGATALLPALRAAGQTAGPESFRAYTDAPRLFLRAARLRLLRRERDRRSLRWDQFEALWGGGAEFPEFGYAAALRYQLAQDDAA